MDTIDLASHDQCVIELNSGRKITAEYRYLSGARDYVVVENTIDANNRKRPGLQKYYRSEIVSITKVPDCLPQRPNGNNRADNDGEHQAVNECNKVPPTIKHLNNDTIVGRMIDLSAKAIYIAQCDEQYHAALRDLESQDVIAVSTENKFGRLDTKKPLLAFATAQNVYLFDTLRIGRVNKDIKRMLSTAEPRKVLFNSAKVNDYFMHAENCQIDMYWDILVSTTGCASASPIRYPRFGKLHAIQYCEPFFLQQMSDIVIKQKVQIKDLIECAQQYFDIPDDLSDSSEVRAAL